MVRCGQRLVRRTLPGGMEGGEPAQGQSERGGEEEKDSGTLQDSVVDCMCPA